MCESLSQCVLQSCRMKMSHILLLAAAFGILTCNSTHGEEIINGHKAKKNSLQYMASVQHRSIHKCGGFLINSSYVVSAAHCYIKSKDKLSVVFGSHNIDPTRNDLRRYEVKSVHIHPSYKEGPRNGFDIMLLKLTKDVVLNKKVKIAKIPKKHQRVKPNIKCQVAGWGKTKTGKSNVNDLQVADVSTINIAVCKKEWANVFTLPPDVLCAGAYKTKSGACQGDSGGPLVCNGVAVGIVSFNYNQNCTYPNFPNVYTDISAYSDWIKKVITGHA
ncbi:trypsin-like [Tachysurus fulvidraco]|uniref:trypsin-like n=1 Tax=Tachysurus fulvidraco TaxID=1234273 RepID=UPI001FEEDC5F|nr:trypsin-like [Tachysurus fulvidraco]